MLLDYEVFLHGLGEVFGMDAYYRLGVEGRKSRNDYMVVVRTPKQLRYRDIKRVLMFRHVGDTEGEVPLLGFKFLDDRVGRAHETLCWRWFESAKNTRKYTGISMKR